VVDDVGVTNTHDEAPVEERPFAQWWARKSNYASS